MLKYISKFVLDILPSVVATIVGAYIVNHYIVPKSDAGKPAAAVASTPDPVAPKAKANEKPVVEKATVEKAAIEKSDKPDVASAPADSRRHQPAVREKAVAKATPAPAPAVITPPVATVSVAPAVTAPTPEERRDANDLARAAIERLRGIKEAQPVTQETVRAPEPPRVQETLRGDTPAAMPQLPPPIMVSTPPVESFGAARSQPPYAERETDPRRPRPPGEIPLPPPLDLQADATGSTRPESTSVAHDVLSAARSVIHSVIPKQFEH